MNRIWCFMITSFLLAGCTAQKNESIEFNYKLVNHRPKQITYLSYKPIINKESEIIKGGLLMNVKNYMGTGYKAFLDEKGRTVKMFIYEKDDTIPRFKDTWEYLKGNKVQEIKIPGPPPYTKDRNYDFKYVDSLDNDGNVLLEKVFFSHEARLTKRG